MNRMKFVTGIILIASLMATCEKQNERDLQPVDFSSHKKASELIYADNLFAVDLFKHVVTTEAKDNLMISPLSVSIALGMTYNGSEGETKSAFEETLRLTELSSEEINQIHGQLIDHLISVDPEVTMEIANSIWVKDIFKLQKDFADTNRKYYNAEINSLDFDDPASVETINNWVKDKTNEKISKILDQIPPEAAMYLINAIYYLGTWKYEFDENDNQPISFKYADGTRSSIEGMRQQENFNYYDAGNFRIVELPYGNEKYSMVILLPEAGYAPLDIVNELSLEKWQDWMDNLSEKEVKLHMPKFRFEYKSLLNDALKEMGLGVAFKSDADFPHMVEEPAELYLSRVLHKTFVDVNEEGTEAAAVTAVEIGVTSVGGSDNVVHFTVDRPFVFVIRERTSKALVFMGKVGSPVYN